MVEAGWPGKGFSAEEATGSRVQSGQLCHLACVPYPLRVVSSLSGGDRTPASQGCLQTTCNIRQCESGEHVSCLEWPDLGSVLSEGEILIILTTTISASGHSRVVTSQVTSEPLPPAARHQPPFLSCTESSGQPCDVVSLLAPFHRGGRCA